MVGESAIEPNQVEKSIPEMVPPAPNHRHKSVQIRQEIHRFGEPTPKISQNHTF